MCSSRWEVATWTPSRACHVRLQKQFKCPARVTTFPSSTQKVTFFLPCVILLSVICRKYKSFLFLAFSSSVVYKKPFHLLQDFLKLCYMAWIHRRHPGVRFCLCCCWISYIGSLIKKDKCRRLNSLSADSSGALSSPCAHHTSAIYIKSTPFADTGYKAHPSNVNVLAGFWDHRKPV